MLNLVNPMENLLLVGFAFGLRHAVEGDHIAAIASLTNKSEGLKTAIKIGVVWGMGHTLVLFVVGGAVLLMDSVMPKNIAMMLEWFAGLMLVLFGLDVLRRVVKTNINFNDAVAHKNVRIDHQNSQFPIRAFIVGLIHGLAGSAALILLTLNSAESKWLGLSYILIFGLGSTLGMGLLSLIFAFPLNKMDKVKNISFLYQGVCVVAGLFTILFGSLLINEHMVSVLALV